jgi:hypothetical protein
MPKACYSHDALAAGRIRGVVPKARLRRDGRLRRPQVTQSGRWYNRLTARRVPDLMLTEHRLLAKA